ncbi:peptidase M61 [Flavobacterium sp.]|uniref:M61 family metallopeptidase n=1 Tax=Flavobacterium sp. TaxID=239 RepID=UPI003787DDAC
MKKIIFAFALSTVLWSCKTTSSTIATSAKEEIQVNINLIDIKDDKVLVTVKSPKIHTDEITYHIPKIVPGTYSDDDYGKYIDNLKAYDSKGNLLAVKKSDVNSWSISNAKKLDKITYLVNDTFDTETGKSFGDGEIFSPAGSNIDAGKNVMLNTHCFVGYFTNYMSTPYIVTVSHPAGLWGATSMIDQDASTTNDLFVTSRYAELVENPVMYSKPDFTDFKVDDMEIQIAVYSPNGKITAESITPGMKTMMTAQKHFLGKFNATKKYSVLLYLSDMSKPDARGYGALEHPTATTVVMPEMLGIEKLASEMKDVVSHEFFHIVTPLTIHSQEIQNFDYNKPKMSEHLWMYEGVTEYFANLFQVNQGLITEDDFYTRMSDKIEQSKTLDDTMPFTTMSANVLVKPYKDQYLNVYQKGALIGMCLDIIIREKSDGKKGILDLMQKLSNEYGVSKAFNDDELFAKITELTYPEVGDFLKTYVSGTTPIPYEFYLAKVGVSKAIKKIPSNVFLEGETRFISGNRTTKEIVVTPDIELNIFYTSLGLKGNDILKEINAKAYSLDNIYDLISENQNWKENDPITVKIKRDGKEQIIKGFVKLPYMEIENLEATDASKTVLKEAWLKG